MLHLLDFMDDLPVTYTYVAIHNPAWIPWPSDDGDPPAGHPPGA